MNKNFKKILGFLIVFIIGISTTVGAVTIFNSKDITYSSDKTTKTNVKEALDELYENLGKCPKGQYCYTEAIGLSDKVELGDYIRMTPTSTSYTISKDLTGYTSDQTINPSELDLWRVIKKNEDGTVDVVSEYVSSISVAFYGRTGYMNYVGALNEIAKQYINEKYVSLTRNFGYEGQIEYCLSISLDECPNDSILNNDWKHVKQIGNLYRGKIKGSETISAYYVSGRSSSGKIYTTSCYMSDVDTLTGCGGLINANGEKSLSRRIRPILVLKANVKIQSGDGKSKETAYNLE